MARTPSARLPDLEDDATFRARLQPLARAVVPGTPETRTSDIPENWNSGSLEAARKIEAVYQARGAKRRFEYLLPERVGNALAEDARARGQSAAHRLLEILRASGYPVIAEDFMDVRKMPKR